MPVLFPLILSQLVFCLALLSFCHQDTHNDHRDLQLPSGDVLIHAGDFTQFGKEEHARDFNAWLGDPWRKVKSKLRGPERVQHWCFLNARTCLQGFHNACNLQTFFGHIICVT